MIRVKLGALYHYGIYASDGEVFQFGSAPTLRCDVRESELAVCASDLLTFLAGGTLERAVFDSRERAEHRASAEVLAYARAQIGRRGYHILKNNCEHFAYECLTGTPYCSQTERVRNMFRAQPVLDVYVAPIPDGVTVRPLLDEGRNDEIADVGSAELRRQKYCAWRLLELAIERSFDRSARDVRFVKTVEGKWDSDSLFFSISHTRCAVAVAVSRMPIGVDLEPFASMTHSGVVKKLLTEREKERYEVLSDGERDEFLLGAWCMKEALFKKTGEGRFSPAEIETGATSKVKLQRLTLGEEEYFLAVAADTPMSVMRLFTDLCPR